MDVKSVKFSRKLVSDKFNVEHFDELLFEDLFYLQKELIGFDNYAIRSDRCKVRSSPSQKNSLNSSFKRHPRQDTSRESSDSLKSVSKKSVHFSTKIVSDTFYIERIPKHLIPDLFYSEKEELGFQINAMRSAERKAARSFASPQVCCSNSEGALGSSHTGNCKEDCSRNLSKSKKSSRSSRSRKLSRSSSDGALQSLNERDCKVDSLRELFKSRKSSKGCKSDKSRKLSSSSSKDATGANKARARDILLQQP